jgi:plasmid stability protein
LPRRARIDNDPTMGVNLTVRNVDERIVDRLRRRAARNHRSLQGELLAILEEQAIGSPRLTPADVLRAAPRQGLKPRREVVKMIRATRDAV